MNRNRLRKLQAMGVTLIGAAYLLHYNNSTVLADDITEVSVNTSSRDVVRNTENITATSNTTLNQAILEAIQEGIEVVETESETYASYKALDNDYLAQIQTITEETRLYQEAKKSYNKQLEAYQLNQKEIEQYQNDLSHYNQYLKDQEAYHEAYSRYQKDNQAYEMGLVANQKLEEAYQQDLAVYKEQLVTYEKDKKAYENSLVANARAKSEYAKLLEQYQSDLKVFAEAQKVYDDAKKREAEQKAIYQKAVEKYNQDLKEYELEKAVYDEKLAEAQSNTKKEGYLSQVHAQYLIFKSEPNARVSFENVSHFFDPNHQFGGGLSGIGGKIADFVLSDQPHLFEGVGGATPAGAGNGYGLILEKGKPITVSYTGLEKSSYNGRAITKVVYTYELTSTFADDGKATAFIYTDPTKTIYVGTSGNNQGQTDFNIHQTITYYYNDTEKVVLAPNTTALLSFASRNNTFEFGEQEYVKMGEKMTFIPITGSSVSGEDNYIASRGSNNSVADGSRFNRDDWDKDGHDNEYYGAGVVQVTGDAISFDFGIRYSSSDIAKSANPARLRNGSRQWFTVNSDLKASGILKENLREKPEAPKEPEVDKRLLVAPTKPTEPKEPRYDIQPKPVKPTEPHKPSLQTLVKPTEPTAPKVVTKPVAPELVPKPLGILKPILFYHRNYYKPIVAPAYSAKLVETGQARLPRVVYVVDTPTEPKQPFYGITPYTSYYSGTVAQSTNTTRGQATSQPLPKPAKKVNSNIQTPKAKSKSKSSKKDSLVDNFRINLDIGKNTEGKLSEKEANAASKATLNYIDYIAEKLTKKHKGDQAKVNRDIALMLAYKDYSGDKLQQMLNHFVKPYKHENKSIVQGIISENHQSNNGTIDFAHTMTTIASLQKQDSKRQELTKGIFSLQNPLYYVGLMMGSGYVGSAVITYDTHKNITTGNYSKETILQLNGFLGDAYTTNSLKDIYSDMDAVILSKHPTYKDLPMNERIKKYYSQANLNAKREGLFLEVYDSNKEKAQKRAALEMVEASLTLGGLLALGYGLVRGEKSLKQLFKNKKQIDKNIALTDKEAFGGTLAYWQKHPLNALGDIAGIYGEPLVKIAKKAASYVGKMATKGIAQAKNIWHTTTNAIGNATKPIVNVVKNAFTPTKPVKSANIASVVTRPFVVATKPIVNHVVKPVAKVIKPVVKPLIKPVVKVIKPVVTKIKQIFKPLIPQKPKVKQPRKGKRRR